MAQDTRKDPRAKVLTMTVRYKSATLDEFIEHHSHDVSRGGMFIKTPSPFPPGTLLKFEVKIAEDKKVMQGVGRVVWKREPTGRHRESPRGDGRQVHQDRRRLDQSHRSAGRVAQDEARAFESGARREAAGRVAGARALRSAASGSEVEPDAAAPRSQRAAEAQGHDDRSRRGQHCARRRSRSPEADEAEAGTGLFFPKTESEKDMPPPEDRTVMKQAAELLARTRCEKPAVRSTKCGEAPRRKKRSRRPPRPTGARRPAEGGRRRRASRQVAAAAAAAAKAPAAKTRGARPSAAAAARPRRQASRRPRTAPSPRERLPRRPPSGGGGKAHRAPGRCRGRGGAA